MYLDVCEPMEQQILNFLFKPQVLFLLDYMKYRKVGKASFSGGG